MIIYYFSICGFNVINNYFVLTKNSFFIKLPSNAKVIDNQFIDFYYNHSLEYFFNLLLGHSHGF